ncbi:hypothetical protein K438DRAFT_1966739 [Mycena galopus ATCC 62051]|nr:hypothetical protein K438DRAFT_1966739 [Mycena galopus ATCC 62051]
MSLPATFLEFLPVFRVLSAASFVRSMPLYNVPISVRNFLSRPWHYSSCPFPLFYHSHCKGNLSSAQSAGD